MTQELKNTQFSLLQKEKLAALGEIAAGIAHEINNPIGFIASNLTTMNSYMRKIKEIRYQYKEFFQTVSNETTLSNRLIEAKNNIISREKEQKIDFIMDDLDAIIAESLEGTARISKIVGSMQEFAKTGTEDKMTHNNFNQIIDECLLIIKHDIKSAAEIDRQLQKNLYLSCNKGEIGQVILNILLNSIYAIKTTSVGKGKITIKAYDSAEYIFCIISDTGSGIKEEDLSRIFDPFFTTKDVGHGVGLGLSVAYDIVVKKHNGSLSATSKLSEGTTFTIKLPKEHKY
nr:ATP-binding protein [Pectinatus sottacetonis]